MSQVRILPGPLLSTGTPYDLEHRIFRPDGEVHWVHRRAEVFRDDGGEPLRMAGTVHDITERKALENRLRHQAFHFAKPLPPEAASEFFTE